MVIPAITILGEKDQRLSITPLSSIDILLNIYHNQDYVLAIRSSEAEAAYNSKFF